MGESNRFFRYLNRINSFLFFLVAVTVLVVLGVTFLPVRERFAPAHHGADPEAEETYDFGGNLGDLNTPGASIITRFDGTDEGFMVLQRTGKRSYRGSLSGSSSSAETMAVNVLLFDLRTLKNRWLFQGVKRDIESGLLIRASGPAPASAANPVVGLLIPVAEADTNADGKVTFEDRHALYLYRPGSAGPAKLFDAQSISSMEQLDSGRVLITYYDGKADQAVMLSTEDFKPIARAALFVTPK